LGAKEKVGALFLADIGVLLPLLAAYLWFSLNDIVRYA